MIIYLDNDYKCHIDDDGSMQAVETTAFDGKCKTYIEGFRFIPNGQHWVNDEGETIYGETCFPFKNYEMLKTAQEAYDEANSLLNIITEGVPSDD